MYQIDLDKQDKHEKFQVYKVTNASHHPSFCPSFGLGWPRPAEYLVKILTDRGYSFNPTTERELCVFQVVVVLHCARFFGIELKHQCFCILTHKSRSVVAPRGPVSAPFLRSLGGSLSASHFMTRMSRDASVVFFCFFLASICTDFPSANHLKKKKNARKVSCFRILQSFLLFVRCSPLPVFFLLCWQTLLSRSHIKNTCSQRFNQSAGCYCIRQAI